MRRPMRRQREQGHVAPVGAGERGKDRTMEHKITRPELAAPTRQRGRPVERRGRPSRRRVTTVGLAMMLAVATLTVVGVSGVNPFHQSASAGAAPVCQSDGSGGCTVTLPCASGPCPSVDVSPASSLSDSQYVFVKATNFPSGDSMRIAICSTLTSDTDPSCLNGEWESNTWNPVQVPIAVNAGEDNLTQAAVPVFFDEAGEGNNPLPAHDVINAHGVVAGFYCDNTANPCAIEVTEEVGTGKVVGNGPTDTSANTAVVPLNFAAQNAGCPSSDPQLQTYSSYSLEHFLPAAVDSSCTSSSGVVALNTATDDQTVASNYASGNATIAFIDDPGDATEQAILAGKSYALIPVAVSGTAVSMLAADSDGETAFPVSEYKLTPNMVAGLMTSDYQNNDGSVSAVSPYAFEHDDIVAPPITCAEQVGCPVPTNKKHIYEEHEFQLQDNAFDLLNPVSAGIYGSTEFASYDSDVATGSSYQVTDWVCNAPNTPYNVTINEVGQSSPTTLSVTDPNQASTTLTTPPNGSSVWPPSGDTGAAWVYPTCKAYATLPALAGVANDYGEETTPAIQAKSIRSYAYGGNSVPSQAGISPTQMPAAFGIMDSSEAAFYGLNDASLQNAAGDFEAPTESNLTAAESELSPCPALDPGCLAGTYQVDYGDTTNTTAYAMPDVTYAVVSTEPQPAAQAKAEADLLTNLVNYSHKGGGTVAFPSGYAPLSDSLYQAAMTDIGNDIVAEPAGTKTSTTATTAPATTTATTSTTTSGSSPSTSDDNGSSASDLGSSLSSTLPESTSSGTGSGASTSSGGGGTTAASTATPTGFLLVSLDTAARFLLPAIVVLALACLIAGPLLLFAPALRRRRRGSGGAP